MLGRCVVYEYTAAVIEEQRRVAVWQTDDGWQIHPFRLHYIEIYMRSRIWCVFQLRVEMNRDRPTTTYSIVWRNQIIHLHRAAAHKCAFGCECVKDEMALRVCREKLRPAKPKIFRFERHCRFTPTHNIMRCLIRSLLYIYIISGLYLCTPQDLHESSIRRQEASGCVLMEIVECISTNIGPIYKRNIRKTESQPLDSLGMELESIPCG